MDPQTLSRERALRAIDQFHARPAMGRDDHAGAGPPITGAGPPIIVRAMLAAPRVLVVEDDAVINQALGDLLRDEAYDATCVTTLEQARARLGTSAPACMVLDLNLPDGTGEELLCELTEHGAAPPCVLLSAATDAARVAARFGIALVRKPFELETLLVEIAKAIRRTIAPRDRSAMRTLASAAEVALVPRQPSA